MNYKDIHINGVGVSDATPRDIQMERMEKRVRAQRYTLRFMNRAHNKALELVAFSNLLHRVGSYVLFVTGLLVGYFLR